MHRLGRAHRATPAILGASSLAAVAVLLVWDGFPGLFPPRAHDFLGALPLALIACSYLAYQAIRRPEPLELLKAIMLAVAFLFWAANQLWPDIPRATLFNDVAIALFVLDVFLVIVGWPASVPDESFAETFPERNRPGMRPTSPHE
ncbi:MAG TPA: hypothetical protein VF400_05850 [Anaeromyxobacteraceae bacterium]